MAVSFKKRWRGRVKNPLRRGQWQPDAAVGQADERYRAHRGSDLSQFGWRTLEIGLAVNGALLSLLTVVILEILS